jgi:hypothetical protein
MIRRRFTFANVTSFLALFVALSAGSYAAIRVPANSVGTRQIKSNAVRNPKLANGAVSTSKIESSAVTARTLAGDSVDGSKVADGSLTGADINLTTLGKVPSAAAADTATLAGSAPIARVKTVTAAGKAAENAITRATATCDQGLAVVGGGALIDPANGIVNDAFPGTSNSWTADVYSVAAGIPFTVYAICAPAAST